MSTSYLMLSVAAGVLEAASASCGANAHLICCAIACGKQEDEGGVLEGLPHLDW